MNLTVIYCCRKLKKQRQIIVERNKEYRQLKEGNFCNRRVGPDKDYGPEARQSRLSTDVLQREKVKEMFELRKLAEDRVNIKIETRALLSQKDCVFFEKNASKFEAVC